MTHVKYTLVYGLLSGIVIMAIMISGFFLLPQDGVFGSVWYGYLVMLVVLTFIFIGVKRYRDVERGGVIGFWHALGLGLAIAVVAGLAYAAVWEIYLALTQYSFMESYAAGIAQQRQAEGASAAAIAKELAELDRYRNPLYRVPMTFMEMFPVGVIVAFASAALLRNPRLLPAAR